MRKPGGSLPFNENTQFVVVRAREGGAHLADDFGFCGANNQTCSRRAPHQAGELARYLDRAALFDMEVRRWAKVG